MTDRYAADFRIEGEGLTAGDVDEVKIQLWEVADAFGGSVIVQRKPWPGPLVAAVPPPGPADADLRDRIEVWPLKRVLAEVRCGSSDWTWAEEWADLDRRHSETGYLAKLEQQIRENGITMPVLIGSDGRLWDGHHRLRIAVRLGIDYVPVEITPSAEPRPPFDVEAGLQRNTTVVVQPLESCPQCAWGVDHVEHCPHPESHNAGCGCFSDEPPAQEPTLEEADRVLDERVAAAKEQQAGEA